MSAPRFVEVSHRIVPGMTTYPGLPVPTAEVVVDYEASRARYEGRAEFFIASLHLCGNTGTYVDSPRHRHRDGPDLADLSLEVLAHLPLTVVDVQDAVAVGPDALVGLAPDALAGRAVLFHTGFARHWGTERYLRDNPFLTAATCEALVAAGARFVGIDSLNIDDTRDPARPAHTILLGAGVPVCEHLTNLAAVPPDGRLHAVPIAWEGGATFPVRAYVVADA